MVKFVHHRLNVFMAYVLKTAAFGKVLPDQLIGIFRLSRAPTNKNALGTTPQHWTIA